MRPRTKESDLRATEHPAAPGEQEAAATLAREAVAEVKRELAAIVLVGLAGLPLVALWLDGWRELAVLAGYGVGGAIWIRVRAWGVLLAAGDRPARRGGDGT